MSKAMNVSLYIFNQLFLAPNAFLHTSYKLNSFDVNPWGFDVLLLFLAKNDFEVVDDVGHDSTAVSRFSSGSIF